VSNTGVTLADEGEQVAVFQSGGKGDSVLVWRVRVTGRADPREWGLRRARSTARRIGWLVWPATAGKR
jgi:hypothetical protein